MSENPYTVEVVSSGCKHCAAGRTFEVVYKEGTDKELSMGTTFENECAAVDLCDELNEANSRAFDARQPEIDTLKAQLAEAKARLEPGPCGKPGHLVAHMTIPVSGYLDHSVCTLCQRETKAKIWELEEVQKHFDNQFNAESYIRERLAQLRSEAK
jgi:hypothetical protein